MRLRICRRPLGPIEGVSVDDFQVGLIYEVGPAVANAMLAAGWAEPVYETDTTEAPVRPRKRSKALVLVVDDEPLLRELTKTLLTRNGYDVVTAEHGLAGLEQLCEHCPDVILLDLNMPVMDGWRFRAEQRRLKQATLVNIPVVLLTGAPGAAEHAATLQAVAAVEKPFETDRLLAAVRTALRAG